MPSKPRRTFLGMLATGTAASIAGCSSSCPDDDPPDPSHIVGSKVGSGFETLPDSSWPSPRFDAANTSYTPVQMEATAPSIQWKTHVSTSSATDADVDTGPVVVADETVVLTTPESVVALSLSDGTEQWRRSLTPATVPSVVGIGETPASPVLSNGRVFLATANGVVALDIDDGTVVWWNTDSPGTGVPVVTRDALFVPTADGISRFESDTGERQWTADVNGTRLAVANSSVVATDEQTVALDAETGEVRWRKPEETSEYPVVSDETIYLSTYGGLLGRSLADGTEQWHIDRGRSFEMPVVTPESVYAIEIPGEAPSATFAFDRVDDGQPEPRWCSETSLGGAVTAAADGTVFTSQMDDGLTAFTTRFGEAVWRYSAEPEVGSLAVLDGGIVSVSPDGTVVAIGGE